MTLALWLALGTARADLIILEICDTPGAACDSRYGPGTCKGEGEHLTCAPNGPIPKRKQKVTHCVQHDGTLVPAGPDGECPPPPSEPPAAIPEVPSADAPPAAAEAPPTDAPGAPPDAAPTEAPDAMPRADAEPEPVPPAAGAAETAGSCGCHAAPVVPAPLAGLLLLLLARRRNAGAVVDQRWCASAQAPRR